MIIQKIDLKTMKSEDFKKIEVPTEIQEKYQKRFEKCALEIHRFTYNDKIVDLIYSRKEQKTFFFVFINGKEHRKNIFEHFERVLHSQIYNN